MISERSEELFFHAGPNRPCSAHTAATIGHTGAVTSHAAAITAYMHPFGPTVIARGKMKKLFLLLLLERVHNLEHT